MATVCNVPTDRRLVANAFRGSFHSFARLSFSTKTTLRMIRPFVVIALCLFIAGSVSAQNLIALDYSISQLREEFSDQNENWTYMTTVENLYMPDKGDLFMHRNHPSTSYAFITKMKNELKVFAIQTKMKLGPAETNDQTIGVICLVQRDGKGAIVVEFNRSKEYRIKKLIGAYYRHISGTAEGQGWVKSNLLKGKEDYNELDIRVALPQVDVYINGKLAQSFDVPEYDAGEMGVIIGPNTKAKVDWFYVNTTAEEISQLDARKGVKEEKLTTTELLSKQRYELEFKDRNLRDCENERIKAVSLLEEEKGRLLAENEKLALQIRQLAEFRDQVLVDIDEDAFLTLAQNLKSEIIKNERLEAQVQIYRDSLKFTHTNYNKLKLALLDKSIKKAEKEKVERDQKEAITTKKEIESELLDKKLMKEQEEWEKKNYKPGTLPPPAALTEKKAPQAEVKKEEKGNSAKVSDAAPLQAAPATGTSGPLPIPVKKAEKKPD